MTGVLLLVVVARVALAGKISTPWILLDEIIYSEIAKSIATDGHRYVREPPYDFPSFVYPALISPAWRVHGDVPDAYGLAKTMNVVLMTAAAAPTYFWARRLAPPLWAATAVVLVLLMPSMLYTSALMSENAYFPVFLATAW